MAETSGVRFRILEMGGSLRRLRDGKLSVRSGGRYAEREPILAFGRPRGGAAEVKRPSVVLPQIELCVFFSYEKKD